MMTSLTLPLKLPIHVMIEMEEKKTFTLNLFSYTN